MANFEKEISKLLKVEGGYVNHPSDKGGPTNFGITQGTLSSWLGKITSTKDVKNMARATAKKIYKAKYWDVNRTDDINSDLVAEILFDQAVNRGHSTAARMLQSACNLFPGKSIKVDGKIGNMSMSRINAIHDLELANKLIQIAQDSYVQIVKRNPKQLVFLAGWINRTQFLMDSMTRSKTTWPVIPLPKPAIAKEETQQLNLFQNIIFQNPLINKTGLTRALTFLDSPEIKNKDFMTFVDFDIHSSKKRLFIINLITGASEAFKVAHGRYSDLNHDGIADKYSNIPGSGMSSLGAMVVTTPYGKENGGWSKFDTAIKLKGLQKGLNDKVESRAVVFHSTKYVDNDNSALSGRSLGCFAVDDAVAQEIQKRIKGGSLIYAYDKDFIA